MFDKYRMGSCGVDDAIHPTRADGSFTYAGVLVEGNPTGVTSAVAGDPGEYTYSPISYDDAGTPVFGSAVTVVGQKVEIFRMGVDALGRACLVSEDMQFSHEDHKVLRLKYGG